MGYSQGEYVGLCGVEGNEEGKDGYDLVKWIAQQPWRDGNVGMVGLSCYALIQVQTAVEQPPHLKTIFPYGGGYDVYRLNYHGGIFWLMLRAAVDRHGSDSGFVVKNVASAMTKKLTK